MNWIDLVAIFIIIYFAYRGYTLGLVASILNLVSAILSILISLTFYAPIGSFFVNQFGASKVIGPVIGFFSLLIFSEFLLSFLFSIIYQAIFVLFTILVPIKILDKITGIFLEGSIGVLFVTVAMVVSLRLPIGSGFKNTVTKSYWGREIVPQAVLFEPYLRKVIGVIPQETLLYLIPKEPKSDETVKMSFPSNIEIHADPDDEKEMLELLNKERTSRGIAVVVLDPTIVPVARANSEDMFKRSYFSHQNPDGESPFDRMTRGKVEFLLAGENLAYAPSVEIAHKGLMNSPGHRENILRKEFGRVGIGVLDGGVYGKMYTQNFAD